jgi:hypothetical protein
LDEWVALQKTHCRREVCTFQKLKVRDFDAVNAEWEMVRNFLRSTMRFTSLHVVLLRREGDNFRNLLVGQWAWKSRIAMHNEFFHTAHEASAQLR